MSDPTYRLAEFILAAMDVADLTKKRAALHKKLLPAAVDPLLASCDLHAARRLWREYPDTLKYCLQQLPEAKARVLSKSWNPHRAPAANAVGGTELVEDLVRLASSAMDPAARPLKAKGKSPSAIAAE